MSGAFALTIDLDWAPDFAIERMAEHILSQKLKATWFVTHDSPAVRALANESSFELGMHPNFSVPCSHGRTEDEVFAFMRALLPRAVSMRAHRFHQSSPLFVKAMSNGVIVDSSLLMPGVPELRPYAMRLDASGRELIRVPVYWEDDVHTFDDVRTWSARELGSLAPGLKVFNFHPMFVHLNSDSMAPYEALKTKGHFYEMDEATMAPYVNVGAGAGMFFGEFCEWCAAHDEAQETVADIAQTWAKERARA